MAGIVTITFSPVIDKSTSIPALVPEKKLKCADPKMEPGGGGINVARAIKKLGGDAVAIYPAGGYSGQYFNQLMRNEGITCEVIEAKAETRENIIVSDESTQLQYRFGMPGTHLEENEWRQILEAAERVADDGFIVASGSLPPGVPPEIFADIAKIAARKNAKLIVDTSGVALQKAARQGVYLLKPNLAELSALVGKESIELDEIDDAAREIIHKGMCEVVVTSLGSGGALLVTKDKEKHIVPPRVKTKSTVGAGDSMVAGIVLHLQKGHDIETAVVYGVACGTAATMNSGTELCKKEDVQKIYEYIRTGR